MSLIKYLTGYTLNDLLLEVAMDSINSMIEELISLVDRKRQLFDNIMEITLEQKKDIEENGANNIEEHVNKKQVVIDSVDAIDKSFSELLNMVKKQLNINSLEEADLTKYPTLRNLKLKVEGIMELAKNIMKIEESNKEKLTSLMAALKQEMSRMSVGKKSIKAYEAPVFSNDGIYIDKKK